jgi:hypothetical protein
MLVLQTIEWHLNFPETDSRDLTLTFVRSATHHHPSLRHLRNYGGLDVVSSWSRHRNAQRTLYEKHCCRSLTLTVSKFPARTRPRVSVTVFASSFADSEELATTASPGLSEGLALSKNTRSALSSLGERRQRRRERSQIPPIRSSSPSRVSQRN